MAVWTTTFHPGEIRHYSATVTGPRGLRMDVIVFATSFESAFEAAIDKVCDKYLRHKNRVLDRSRLRAFNVQEA